MGPACLTRQLLDDPFADDRRDRTIPPGRERPQLPVDLFRQQDGHAGVGVADTQWGDLTLSCQYLSPAETEERRFTVRYPVESNRLSESRDPPSGITRS
jgi:hypothetical protein